MINIKENNKKFAELTMEIIENKYDILFDYEIIKSEDKWSRLIINFSVNHKNNIISAPIHYEAQVIDKLVEDISKRIDEQLIKSYMK
jgi:hypothetical protein